MDLGFGSSNQVVGAVTARALLQGAQAQEQAIEDEMSRFDRLLDDEDALQELRRKRLAQMQQQHAARKKWMDLGHGDYKELGSGTKDARDVAKDFFTASKESERMIVHFYRPSTRHCDVFHAHLSKLAPKHLETRFVKINVEDCDHQGGGASFLVERLGVVIMPTLVLVKDRKAFHHIRGFDEMGATDHFSTQALAYVLASHGIIDATEEEENEPPMTSSSNIGIGKSVNSIRIQQGDSRKDYYDEDY